MQSTENVVQFAVVSTVMPATTRQTGTRYRWALVLSVTLVLLFTLVGVLSAAVLTAALSVPVVFLLYLYDLNVWADTPASVVGLAIGVTAVLGLFVSLVSYRWFFSDQLYRLDSAATIRAGLGQLPVGPFLLFVVVLPAIALLVMNVGPVWLAAQPRFDDLIDGFTFGVAAGTAYAAVETVVAFSSVFSGQLRTTQGIDGWVPLILSVMIVKSLVYGTAAGVAVAAFSGKGEGYAGFTRSYFANLAFALVALVAYWAGVRLLAYADAAAWFALLWGMFVLVVLVIRARLFLHVALLEAALEDVSSGHRSKAGVTDDGWCPECEMPLLADALFCVVCGQSVRATSGESRRVLRAPSTGGAA